MGEIIKPDYSVWHTHSCCWHVEPKGNKPKLTFMLYAIGVSDNAANRHLNFQHFHFLPFFLRQRIKRNANCHSVFGLVSSSIRQALALDAFQRLIGAGCIANAARNAVCIAEVKL